MTPCLPRPQWLALLVCVGLNACAHPAKRPQKNIAPPAFVGSVRFVDEQARFVLIDAGYFQTPPDGTALTSFTGETPSAALKISPEHRRPFVIADIVSGAPQKGDLVRQTAMPAPPAAPAPALPAAETGLPGSSDGSAQR